MTAYPRKPAGVSTSLQVGRAVNFLQRDAIDAAPDALVLLKRKVQEFDALEISSIVAWRSAVGALTDVQKRLFQGCDKDRRRCRHAAYSDTRASLTALTTALDTAIDWTPSLVTNIGVWLDPHGAVSGIGTAGFQVTEALGATAQNLTNTTVANQPAQVDSGTGALVLDFDNTDYLDVANGSAVDVAFSVMGWIGLWAKSDEIPAVGAANNQFIYAHTSTTNLRCLMFTSSTDQMVFRYTTSAGADVATFGVASYGEVPDLNWHWHEVFYNGGAVGDALRLRIFKDDVQKTLAFTATVPATLPNVVGAVPLLGAGALRNGGLSFKGKLGSMFVVSGSHPSAFERQAMKNKNAPLRLV